MEEETKKSESENKEMDVKEEIERQIQEELKKHPNHLELEKKISAVVTTSKLSLTIKENSETKKPEWEPVEIPTTPALLQMFLDYFNDYSWNNELYGKITFHVLLGSLLPTQFIQISKQRIDARIHCFMMQRTGSGKSFGTKPLENIYAEINGLLPEFATKLKITSRVEYTDAALIGTIEEVSRKKNKMTGEVEILYKPIYGDLASSNILCLKEASSLFIEKEYTKETLNILQQAMDAGGQITKKLAHGSEINYNSPTSFIMLSTFPEEIVSPLLRKGFFQRVLFLPRQLSDDEVKGNMYMKNDLVAYGIEDSEEKITLSAIAQKFNQIREFYLKNQINQISPTAKAILESGTNKLTFFPDRVSDKLLHSTLLDFANRYQTIAYVLALHYAALRLSTVIEKEDVLNALMVVRACLDYIADWLEDSMDVEAIAAKSRRHENYFCAIIKNKLREAGGVMEMHTLKEIFTRITGKSAKTAQRYIRKLIEDKILAEEENTSITSNYRKVFLKTSL